MEPRLELEENEKPVTDLDITGEPPCEEEISMDPVEKLVELSGNSDVMKLVLIHIVLNCASNLDVDRVIESYRTGHITLQEATGMIKLMNPKIFGSNNCPYRWVTSITGDMPVNWAE